MKNVLFITHKLQNYRIPILELIAKERDINLTVAHSGKPKENKRGSFEEYQLLQKKVGPFLYYPTGFDEYIKRFDVVVCMFYLNNLSFLKLALLLRRKFRLIYWGIGVRASYNSNFDDPTIMNQVRYFLAKRSDAMLFYSEYARLKYIKKGLGEEKLFVMPNTVEVIPITNKPKKRDKILFIGSLYKQKKIFELLDSYKAAYLKCNKEPKELHIIGNGDEFNSVKNWITTNKLNHKIVLHGSIFEEQKLSTLFSSGLACISPGQAGLSVLKSFGYSVPFITHSDAITGGERLNIVNKKNGILFQNYEDLSEIILSIFESPEKFKVMGENAKAFYDTHRTPKIMAQGFIDAVRKTTEKPI
nr:glycosyltransferase [uncultured Allomuricauda sp.]